MDNEKEQLDNPLVVHNKNDASYYDKNEAVEMEETLTMEEEEQLARHRYKKDPKKRNKRILIIVIIILIIAGVFCALYFTGNIKFNTNETTSETESTTVTTTSIQDAYKGTIVVKDTYIFVDGLEVDGIEGLQSAIRYTDASDTAYVIINDNANSDFLNNDVLPILLDMGFYGDNTEIKHAMSETPLKHTELTTVAETTTE